MYYTIQFKTLVLYLNNDDGNFKDAPSIILLFFYFIFPHLFYRPLSLTSNNYSHKINIAIIILTYIFH